MTGVAEPVRLDQALVIRGLVPSRERGQTMIRAGFITVAGRVAERPDQLIAADAVVEVRSAGEYVSRGGDKLSAALDALGIDPKGRSCLDVGASTGGFTDVLLRRGAARVIAVDVGYGQLAWSLRQDPRVHVMERANIRHVQELPYSADLAVIDVSFISLRLVLPAVQRLLSGPGDVVALVKPQFEAGKRRVGKGGVIRDPEVHSQILRELREFATSIGYGVRGEAASPILGAKGNREFFLHLRPDG